MPANLESVLQVQSKLRAELGLHKIPLVHNKNYQRHGTKSYVYLLNRFGFQPTKPGPYFHATVNVPTLQAQAHVN